MRLQWPTRPDSPPFFLPGTFSHHRECGESGRRPLALPRTCQARACLRAFAHAVPLLRTCPLWSTFPSSFRSLLQCHSPVTCSGHSSPRPTCPSLSGLHFLHQVQHHLGCHRLHSVVLFSLSPSLECKLHESRDLCLVWLVCYHRGPEERLAHRGAHSG